MSQPDPHRLVGDYVLAGSELIVNGAIDIDATGRIAAVDALESLPATPYETRRLGGLLMPGLVNAHAHTPMTLVRSAGDGLPLQEWLTDGVWPREFKMKPDDARVGMLVGWAEMLQAGVTTSCEMYLHEESIIEATASGGGRLVMAAGIVAALAPDGNIEGRVAEITALHKRAHAPAEGVSIGFGPHSLYDLSPDQIAEIGEQARALDALVHIHLEETARERDEVIAKWNGRTATELLADAGVLEGRLLAAHGVWLSDSDQRLLGKAGAGLAHCPMSNLKLGSGIAPTASMLDHGIRVGIGTDGVASNDNLDLWEELKLTPLLARGVAHDPRAMSPGTALELATVGGAQAIGLDDVGLLAPGFHADVIRVDLDRPEFAPQIEDDLLTSIVFSGSSSAVTDVWVAGNPVVVDREVLTIDVEKITHDAVQRGRALAE